MSKLGRQNRKKNRIGNKRYAKYEGIIAYKETSDKGPLMNIDHRVYPKMSHGVSSLP